MALGKQQTCWDSPEFTRDCLLTNVGRQLEADGCVLEYCEAEVSSPPLTTREQRILLGFDFRS
jgi:hypothetical protein